MVALGLVSDRTAAELADGVRVARGVAQGALGEKIERRRQRSASKTRKSRATRQRIMTAASELMAERGATDFQMSEVSARCHMSKGALYYYFSDKDELVQAVLSNAGDELVQTAEAIVDDSSSAREALEGLCAEFARRIRVRSPLVLAATQELSSEGAGGVMSVVSGQLLRLVRIISRQLELGKSEGLVDPDEDVVLASVYITGGMVAAAVGAATVEATATDSLAESLMRLAVHGVAPRGEAEHGQASS